MVTDVLELKLRLARNFRDARLAAGLNQEDLGQLMGVRRNEINAFENGRRKITDRVLVNAGHALGHDPSWFYIDHTTTPT